VTRLAVLVVATLVVLGLTWAWRRRQRSLQVHEPDRRVPVDLLGEADRTWLLFRTPFCATCGPAAARLRALDPGAALVVVDATERPDLTDRLRISAAPTVLLAGPDGRVSLRLSGPRAVNEHLDALVSRS
jgi:hypothetical protein